MTYLVKISRGAPGRVRGASARGAERTRGRPDASGAGMDAGADRRLIGPGASATSVFWDSRAERTRAPPAGSEARILPRPILCPPLWRASGRAARGSGATSSPLTP